jgi:pimeloyl-ACP methyl ester carboxylesterase
VSCESLLGLLWTRGAYPRPAPECGGQALWPGSRLDFAANAAAATAAGVRVIAVDRPGMGGSDPQPNRKVLDWPGDVTALADSLGLDRFAGFGWSFGGPYAGACAYALPDRIVRAGLVACLGPIDDPAAKSRMPAFSRCALAAGRFSPSLVWPMAWLTAWQARGGKLIHQFSKHMAPDAEVLSRQDVADALGRSLAECFRQGVGSAAWDGLAVARGEGVRLEDIQPQVLIWHGDHDRNVPVAMAGAEERRLPHVRARR